MASFLLGVAGYMGCGKTTAASFLRSQGWQVIDADRCAKDLMNRDQTLQSRLIHTFGPTVCTPAGVDFAALGSVVFDDLAQLRALNAIVHPTLLRELRAALDSLPGSHCVLDAALISLWGIEAWFDALCWIDADAVQRIARICTSGRLTPEAGARRMALQEALFARPDAPPWHFIDNNATPELLHAHIMAMPWFHPAHHRGLPC